MHCKELIKGKKWVCVADGPTNPVTGKRRQISRRGKSKGEAKKKVEEAIRSISEDGIDTSVSKEITFEIAANSWIEVYRRGNVKESTVDQRLGSMNTLFNYFGKVNIAKITPTMYQNVIMHLDDKGSAYSTIESIHTTANMIFKFAITKKWIKDNPRSGALIPKRKLTVEEIENDSVKDKYLESSEVHAFLKAVTVIGLEQDIEMFYLLAFTGMRSSELCALKWTDINFEEKTIRITKTIYSKRNNRTEYELTPPKTVASIREFDVDDVIIELLANLKDRKSLIKKSAFESDRPFHDENFVFSTNDGYPFLRGKVLERMERILSTNVLSRRVTPHVFRHTHISMLTEAGVDLRTIMERVGHDEAKTTLEIYTHVTNKMKERAKEKVRIKFKDILNLPVLNELE